MPNDSTAFVDTNVLLYAQDLREPGKRAAATAWLAQCWRRRTGRISTQVLHEFYANLRKAAPGMSLPATRALVQRYRAWQPWQVDETTVDRAWALQDRFEFHYWDALMVAAAQQMGCALLLTEDLQHGQMVDRLRIVNPFLLGPEILDTPA
ncbi:Ribonuclease VapC [Rubrivivax sp. A210]|uniref:PIN domain-containing protein n=1 Tax=Rubrivivax sp. A210 TaxID=2772301 RepID=UPI00191ADB26|nr:PIN domain-containing protein [Rubrivivax sp. A210]CAD5372188.1 Ribonuclease VapC [Rubrivivax sp. A210]